MTFLNNKIPPPVVAAIFATLMWLISKSFSAVIVAVKWPVIVPAVLLGLGIVVCGLGVWSFKCAKTTVNPLMPESASSLVTSGIYRYTRNPMYVGFVLALLAWALFLNSLGSLLPVFVYVAYIQQFQIKPEEKALVVLFGAEFEQYQQRVRRWL